MNAWRCSRPGVPRREASIVALHFDDHSAVCNQSTKASKSVKTRALELYVTRTAWARKRNGLEGPGTKLETESEVCWETWTPGWTEATHSDPERSRRTWRPSLKPIAKYIGKQNIIRADRRNPQWPATGRSPAPAASVDMSTSCAQQAAEQASEPCAAAPQEKT